MYNELTAVAEKVHSLDFFDYKGAKLLDISKKVKDSIDLKVINLDE